jgi:hypothetical protein
MRTSDYENTLQMVCRFVLLISMLILSSQEIFEILLTVNPLPSDL